jgi:hypothetical protein
LRPEDFSWREAYTGYYTDYLTSVPELCHVPSGSYFTFDWSNDNHAAAYSPADSSPTVSVVTGTWDAQLIEFAHWLVNVQREFSTPDLWAELEAKKQLLDSGDAVENTPFAPAELAQVLETLAEVKAYSRETLELTAGQQAQLDAKLEYLATAAGRMGRLDWRSLLVGAIVETMLSAAIPQGAAQATLQMILRGVSHLYGIDLPELPAA